MPFLSSGLFESVRMERPIFEGRRRGNADFLLNDNYLGAGVERVGNRFLVAFKLIWDRNDLENKNSLLHELYSSNVQKRMLIDGEKSAYIGIDSDTVEEKKIKKTSIMVAEEVPFVVMKGHSNVSVIMSRLVMVSLNVHK